MAAFGYEKLRVYQKGLEFYSVSKGLVSDLPRKVAACDHLNRAAESVPLNIAHASSCWSPEEKVVYLGHANGSALECAACLDVLVAKCLLAAEIVATGKSLLREIVSMLIAWRRTASDRAREDSIAYQTETEKAYFSHERLDVYRAGLQVVGLIETMRTALECSADLISKLDRASTAVVLQIAEGNGRFSSTDQVRFLGMAYKSAVQTGALVDLATVDNTALGEQLGAVRQLLPRIAAMLTSLAKAKT